MNTCLCFQDLIKFKALYGIDEYEQSAYIGDSHRYEILFSCILFEFFVVECLFIDMVHSKEQFLIETLKLVDRNIPVISVNIDHSEDIFFLTPFKIMEQWLLMHT